MAKLAYHFEAGGWAMWLILVCLVFAIGFTIERAMYLYKASIDKDEDSNVHAPSPGTRGQAFTTEPPRPI